MYLIPKLIRKIVGWPVVQKSVMDKTAKADAFSSVVASSLGAYSYVGAYTELLYTRVGKYTSISSNCAIGSGEHPMDWVSTSPIFNASKSILRENFSENVYQPFQETVIGHDVWIGHGVKIKSGVTIGNGAVIGAGAVVTKNVGAYEIWAGVPAKCIKKRFAPEICESLQALAWWDWPQEKVRRYADDFVSPARLLEKLEEEA